jgi:hypothetical protein
MVISLITTPTHTPNTKMKTRSYHISNLGSYAPSHIADNNGYVTYHDSDRYGKATDEQLEEWAESRTTAVRNAAITEQAERKLAEWQTNSL